MHTRRQFLVRGTVAGAGLMLPFTWTRAARAFTLPTLALGDVTKYATAMVIPPAMPRTGKIKLPGGNKNVDYYEIAVRQFAQQILPPGMPMTTVWSYGSVNHPGTFNYPAFTIEAKWQRPTRVKWINDLKTAAGTYLPHLLPVDPTLHWANLPGGTDGRDMRPEFLSTPDRYMGPVPIVTHLHGARVTQESDGFPEAWYLPNAWNIPAGFARKGTYFDIYKGSSPIGADWADDAPLFEYGNDQPATTLWYHDHTLGMTRLNVYAGPAGFYLLRGGPGDGVQGVLPGPAPALGDAPGTKYYEIPIAVQDRSFNADGSLFYADSREFFDGYSGPYVPETDVPPIWNPEFFGNTIVVNGNTWPFLEVEKRRYRFRFLNGCNSRFLILQFEGAALPFWQIGAEQGFLPAPVQLTQLLMAPAERADVIVDFTNVPAGTSIKLLNLGPDEPFGGGVPGVDFPSADATTTGQVMQFRVVPATGRDRSTPPDQLVLPAPPTQPAASVTRRLSLNEMMSMYFDGPVAALLGGVDTSGGAPVGTHKMWADPITENPALGATETWEFHNFTEDAHPIHVHLVKFQVLEREPFGGPPVPPEPWETGYKDTVIAYPGQITRIKATFDVAGRYVWHCHIVEHEDNEMMRPYKVG
jgi:bilirubin oxidase